MTRTAVMKLMVVMCLLAAGIHAQVFGPSGIVYPDGRLSQFRPDQANNIGPIGASGVILLNGSHVQFNQQGVPIHHANAKRAAPSLIKGEGSRKQGKLREPREARQYLKGDYGESGIVYPDGRQVQFSREEAGNIVLIGPSGAVTYNGPNVQLNRYRVPRERREAREYLKGDYGESGIVYPDGRQVQFSREEAGNIVLIGPSGAVTYNGPNVQLNRYRVPVESQ